MFVPLSGKDGQIPVPDPGFNQLGFPEIGGETIELGLFPIIERVVMALGEIKAMIQAMN